ncbi:MAG: RNA-binding domain-containing protein [Candidatus Woesearchaeota archaeon]
MKYLNNVVLSVFAKPSEEDVSTVKQGLIELVPLNLPKEKIEVKEETAQGFNEQQIKIFTITLSKEAHTNAFLKALLNRLTKEQKELLLRQRESRLDSDLHFFIRFDKGKWLSDRHLFITDSGWCYHVKMAVAAFPATRDAALALVEKVFKTE